MASATYTSEPLKVDPFVQVPVLTNPPPNTTWDGKGLASKRSAGGAPVDLFVYDVQSGAGLVGWTVIAPGSRQAFDLPDLDALSPDLGLVPGPLSITVNAARIEDFAYGTLRYRDTTQRGWPRTRPMSFTPATEPPRPSLWAPIFIGICGLMLNGCGYDSGTRWVSREQAAVVPICTLGDLRCAPELEQCAAGSKGPAWQLLDDCTSRGLICSRTLEACAVCEPNQAGCDGQIKTQCDATGSVSTPGDSCDTSAHEVCREARCVNLCSEAAQRRSNVGCEYFAVDLDNAVINDTLNAAAQQFAVVISNPQTDVAADVTIEQDDSLPGAKNAPKSIATASIPPFSLRVFRLGPREVDGSPPGEFNTGTHTALTRHAYRIHSTFPVVAYQFIRSRTRTCSATMRRC